MIEEGERKRERGVRRRAVKRDEGAKGVAETMWKKDGWTMDGKIVRIGRSGEER